MSAYTKEEFEFIDSLLRLSLNNDLTYTNLLNQPWATYELYNRLFPQINQDLYKLIKFSEDIFEITTLGRKVSETGFEKYLENLDTANNLKSQSDKYDTRNRKYGTVPMIINIAILVVATITLIWNLTKDKPKINNSKNNADTTNRNTKNNNIRPTIDTTPVKNISDTPKHIK